MFCYVLSMVFMIFIHSMYVYVKAFPLHMISRHVKDYRKFLYDIRLTELSYGWHVSACSFLAICVLYTISISVNQSISFSQEPKACKKPVAIKNHSWNIKQSHLLRIQCSDSRHLLMKWLVDDVVVKVHATASHQHPFSNTLHLSSLSQYLHTFRSLSNDREVSNASWGHIYPVLSYKDLLSIL